MQARGGALAPGFLFDSDMGRNFDAALALAMLHGLGRGRLIAVGVSHSSLEAAAYCDVLTRFYGGATLVGLAEEGPALEDAPMLRVPLGMRGADGQPTFRHGIRSVLDTADPAVLFRNTLLGQREKQCVAVLAGPATNLVRLLALSGAHDIVASKVQLLVMAAGAFEGGTVDPRIRADAAAARRLLAEWPSPIVAVGLEAVDAAAIPDAVVGSDLAAIPNHPIVAAYEAFRATSAGPLPTQAALGTLYAANTGANHFKLSPTGVLDVGADGRTRFAESSSGRHRHLTVDPAQRTPLTQAFVRMLTVRPAGGGRGGRGPQ